MSSLKFDLLKNLTSKIGSGATPTGGQSSYKKSGVSLIRSQNVLDMSFSKDGLAFIDEDQADKLKNVEVLENDILLNITGDSIARVCKVPAGILPARVNQHVSILRSNGKVDPDFLLYFLIYKKEHLQTISRVGGTRNALTKEAVENLEIRIDKNQQKIAAVLSALDDKIELNNIINAELEAMAKTLYNYWFVQFDFPDAKGKLYKSSGGKMVYNATLKREIPEGWEVKTLSSFINCYDSLRIPISNIEREKIKGNIPYYGATSAMDYINQVMFDKDLILMAEDGSVMDEKGNPILQYVFGQSWINNHAHVFEPKNLRSYDFLKFHLSYINVVEIMTGSIQKKITQNNIMNKFFVFPDELTLAKFDSKLSAIRKKLKNIIKQNQELAQLRDWLLPMLMNGQVTVGDAEEKIGMVAEEGVEYKKL